MADPTPLQNAVSALNQVATGQQQLLTQFQGKQADIEANNQAMQNWQTQPGTVPFKDAAGNMHNIPTLPALVEQAQSVNPNPHVMTKAEFDALREMRKQQYAGSGIVEWGHHNSSNPKVNEGLWTWISSSAPNRLIWGEASTNSHTGESSTIHPLVVVDGVLIYIIGIGHSTTQSVMEFPPAPDGKKTYDANTATLTLHSSPEVAFASETATNKVILSRKDFAFLEVWHEEIAEKDIVYPFGNVQYGGVSYAGIALQRDLVDMRYSALGAWDNKFFGRGAKWSALTSEQKAIFLSEPQHNIYFDPKRQAYIQVRYRTRVIEGRRDDWYCARPTEASGYLDLSVKEHIRPQGSRIAELTDLGLGYPLYASDSKSNVKYPNDYPDAGVFGAMGSADSPDEESGVDGKCFALPLLTFQRLNQGAYHPSNVMGTSACVSANNNGEVRGGYWFNTNAPISSLAECFNKQLAGVTPALPGSYDSTGSIVSSSTIKFVRPDVFKYHDVVYPGLVEDIRVPAKKLDLNRAAEKAMQSIVSGAFRGKGFLPFLKPMHNGALVKVIKTSDSSYSAINSGGTVTFGTQEADNTKYFNGDRSSHWLLFGSNGQAMSIRITSKATDFLYTGYSNSCYLYGSGDVTEELDTKFPIGTEITIMAQSKRMLAEFQNLPWVDITGTPEDIAAIYPDGVYAMWAPAKGGRVDFTRKVNDASVHLINTVDAGNNWTSQSVTINNLTNGVNYELPDNAVGLWHYNSLAELTMQAESLPFLNSINYLYISSSNAINYGNHLHYSLVGKVGKDARSNTTESLYLEMNTFTPSSYGSLTSLLDQPTHGEISLPEPSSDSSAFKALFTLVQKNGLIYVQFNGAELKYDPLKNNWGDDQAIPIINGENTKADLNRNTVKVFCHHTMFPIGIAHNG
ncbi:hypothetical protein L3V43_04935 [Pseudoalteromonas sp. L23]|uniref:hypothetical protein n=1 Tax=unclassified Pseudoalteromonas TaxID=194690 RepID=UPI001EEFF685|nr:MULTISPECIES: hypothetical protein [unclassified Pseudoalteromonas]MCF7512948.1 hypothetical protein [Pseudoalteromonas sp. L7]MCF7524988.1 hypothetical protein [Pseudoalteromonas sp. L23]